MKTTAYVILLVLVLLSLALNVVLLAGLWTARQAAIEALDAGLEALADLEDETFETSIHVQESIPIDTAVDFRRELIVPVHVTAPISDHIYFNETFEVPIDTALLKMTVDVPVSATIPVSLTVPVDGDVPISIDETFPLHTEVELDLTVPVAIPLSDTPIPDYLEQLRSMLEQVRQELSFGGE